MKQLAILLFLFCAVSLFAQGKLAIINDSDGYVNVRKGKGTNYEIITTINKDEFFYCDTTTLKDEWIKILTMRWQMAPKWEDIKRIEGYVHRSRIQIIENLNYKKQKELIAEVLNKQKKIAENIQTAWKAKDSLALVKIGKERNFHNDCKYDPILDFLPTYFCSTKDTTIIQLLLMTKLADWGSANEQPSYAICKCYTCYPDLVISQINYLEDKEEKEFIFNSIGFGCGFDDDDEYTNKTAKYNNLKTKLNNERKK